MHFIFLPSQHGAAPLFYAAHHGHSEVVKVLLQAGARDIPNKVLHYKGTKCALKSLIRLSCKNKKKVRAALVFLVTWKARK